MSKLEELRRSSGSSVAESMGGGRHPVASIPGEYRPSGPSAVPLKRQGVNRRNDVSDIPLAKIGPDPDQPRKEFDEEAINRLAESLRTRGQLQPIRVRWNDERGQYVVIVGERRYRAASRAGLPTLACVVVEGDIPPDEMLAIQLVENCVREDLLPIDQARAVRSLMDAKGWTQEELGHELGIGQPAVAKALATLRLAPEIQAMVNQGDLHASTAAVIAGLDSPEEQAEVVAKVIDGELTRDQAVEVVRERKAMKPKSPASKKSRGVAKVKLPTERTVKTAAGIKVTLSARKGFDLLACVEALRDALDQMTAKLEPAEGQDAA
jgi:ParB family transcriptional regulator, chromosome partitioning protein